MWNDELTLIRYSDKISDISEHTNGIAEEITVLADVSSVTRTEFYKYASPENKPEYTVRLNKIDYDGQYYCKLRDKEYSIVRTYEVDRDIIELTLAKKRGTRR